MSPEDNSRATWQNRIAVGVEVLGDLIALGAASTGFASVALAQAPGITHPSGDIPGLQDVSFIHQGWWSASLFLCIPLFFLTRRWRSIWLGLAGAAVLTVPNFWAVDVNLDRWSRSGLGDGLEQLAVFIPWVMFFFYLIAAVAGRLSVTSGSQPKSDARHPVGA